jgi:predicted RNase H-like HicB family nuclease
MINYTAKYTKIESGYLGQLVEWPEVLTEGKDLEDCRSMLRDALNEMTRAYNELGKEMPLGPLLNNSPWRLNMSVKRRDLIRHMEKSGFYFLREGGKHSIYAVEDRTPRGLPVDE